MNIIDRLKKVMPEHITPIADNPIDHLTAMEKISQERIKRDEELLKQERIKYLMGRSGISPLHQNCSFENYIIDQSDQHSALKKSQLFVTNFGQGFGGFIFSGTCGTGKNHLAVAICNCLIDKGKVVLCITVSDLMMKFRSTYAKKSVISEEKFLSEICNVDLLILDEIGVQHRNSENTDILINQIVDRRTSNKKSTGMLTNLTYDEMIATLGQRVIDRMMMGGCIWVNFNWENYRSQIKYNWHERGS